MSLVALALLNPVSADDRPLGPLAVEFDPMTTPLGARNVFLLIEPPALPHMTFSVGAFASDFAPWVDDLMSWPNRGQDFDLRVRPSPGLTVDAYLREDHQGLHAGGFLFLWRYEAERGGETAHFTNQILLPRIGYRWFPGPQTRVYLDPFAGVMFESFVAGDNRLDGDVVKPAPAVPFATVHLGLHL